MLREALLAAAILNAVMLGQAVAFFAVPVMAPVIAAELGVDAALVGVYSGILWGAALLTSFAAGTLIARFRPLGVSQLCVALSAIGLVMVGLGSLPTLVLAAALIGLAHGPETPASSQLLARLAPPRDRALVFALKQTGVQIGAILSGVAYPFLINWVGWRGATWIMAGVLAVGAVALRFARKRFDVEEPAPPRRERSHVLGALGNVIDDRRLLRITLAALVFVGAQVCFNTFLVSYLVKDLGFSLALAGSVLAGGQAGGLIGRILWGAVSGRMVPAVTLLTGLGLIMTTGFLILGLSGTALPLGALVAICFVLGLTVSGWNGVYLAEIAHLAPSVEVGRITGASFVLSGLGLVIGPLMFGAVVAKWTHSAAFAMAAGWTLAGVACLVWRSPQRRSA